MRRDIIIALVALMALCGSSVAAAGTARERDERLRGYVDATQTADLPFRQPLLGVNAELTQYNEQELAQQLDLMKAAQVHWVRQFVRWDEIEATEGEYDWSAWDQIVAAFEGRDLKLVAVLMNSPEWAAGEASLAPTDASHRSAAPDDPAAFARFAAEFSARYGQTIDFYQIWDEPNLTAAWGGYEPRAADYAALLQAAYAAIHSADAGATVIAAALAPTTENTALNISDVTYLDDLYRLGAADFMDAVAAKPYGFDRPPEDYTVDPNVLNFSRIVALRDIMLEYGDGQKALWASAWGWNSLPADWTGAPSIWGQVTADERVAYTVGALERAEREWPWIGGMILREWQPVAPPDDPQWGFALVDQRGGATPLLNALIDRPQVNAAQNGLYFPANPYTRYSGVWTFGELGADIGWINDSQFEVDFVGSSVALLLRQGDYLAFLYPTIDGRADLANAAPHDPNGNAFINLRSGSELPELVVIAVAQDLGNEAHTLHVVADRGWDQWALAGIAVSSGDLAAPYDRQIGVALVTAAVSLVAAGLALARINWSPLWQRLGKLWSALGGVGQLVLSVVTSLAVMIGMLLTWNDAVPNVFRREPVQLGLALVTAGLIYIQPHMVVTILACLVLFVIVYHRVELGVMLTVFYAPFFLFPVELYKFAFPMAELVILITAAAWGLKMVQALAPKKANFTPGPSPSGEGGLASPPNPLSEMRRGGRRLTTLDWGVVALVVWSVLSVLWAADRGKAITELRVMVIEPALLYLMLRTTAREIKDLLRVVDAFVIAGVIVSVIGLVLFASGQGVITAEGGAQRLASVYGSPNNVGLLIGRCFPFALAFVLVPLDRTRRLFGLGALGVMGIAAVLSQSAGALFIGLPGAALLVLLLALRRRARLAVVGLAGVGAAVFALAMQSPRFARVFDFGEGTSFFRVRVWQSALQMIAERPLTGWGLDQFLDAFRGQYMMPDAWQEPSLSHPHNWILDWLVRLGAGGLLIFVAVQAAFWQTTIRVYRGQPERLRLALVIGAMGSMLNLLAHGLVDNSVFVPDLAVIFMFLLGIASNLHRQPPSSLVDSTQVISQEG
ncbi:MAG: O-antigen ligase family protein [Chloroflexi bacterium]|nr:O-antigen ligase family protein [Chloroflexota bacterium]